MENCPNSTCQDFTFVHCSKHIHPLRDKICKYYPCPLLHDPNHLQTHTHPNHICPDSSCQDFTEMHCSKYIHNLRDKKCPHDPCLLLHDKNHLQEYLHTTQYQNLSIKNYNINKNHPIFIEDIWTNIDENIEVSKDKLACRCSINGQRIEIINKLLCTSKIFATLLGTNLKYVNTWKYEYDKYKYAFDGFYKKNVGYCLSHPPHCDRDDDSDDDSEGRGFLWYNNDDSDSDDDDSDSDDSDSDDDDDDSDSDSEGRGFLWYKKRSYSESDDDSDDDDSDDDDSDGDDDSDSD
jgi:hypothetical protein